MKVPSRHEWTIEYSLANPWPDHRPHPRQVTVWGRKLENTQFHKKLFYAISKKLLEVPKLDEMKPMMNINQSYKSFVFVYIRRNHGATVIYFVSSRWEEEGK